MNTGTPRLLFKTPRGSLIIKVQGSNGLIIKAHQTYSIGLVLHRKGTTQVLH